MVENWKMFDDMKVGDEFFIIKGVYEYSNHVGICEISYIGRDFVDFKWGSGRGESSLHESWNGVMIAPNSHAMGILYGL